MEATSIVSLNVKTILELGSTPVVPDAGEEERRTGGISSIV
jgi:hypothetical protein